MGSSAFSAGGQEATGAQAGVRQRYRISYRAFLRAR